jgi:hypothetical protein
MRLVPVVLVLVGVVLGSACGSSSVKSCGAYYDSGPPGLTPAQIAFCLNESGKSDGNCCVRDDQCLSGHCCGWDQTCGAAPARESCECYTP